MIEIKYEEIVPSQPTTTEVIIETTTEEVEEAIEDTNIENVSLEQTPQSSYSSYWTITAYCCCPICCGHYAYDRPVDENGNTIVIGASGRQLIPGYSVASDLPMGTKLHIEGYGDVEVMDRGVSGHHLDLYFATHEDALSWGKNYMEVSIIG